MPDLDGILLAPDAAKVPATIGGRWAVSTGLVKKTTVANFGRVLKYLDRLSTSAGSKDFEILTVKDILKTKPEATQCADFGQWAAKNEAVMA